MKLYLNGDILSPEQAGLSPTDRGFTLGDGLFETIKVSHGQPLRLGGHLRRLGDGATTLRLPLPSIDDLRNALARVIAANGLEHGTLRLTVSRGPGQRGLLPPQPTTPTVLITAGLLPPALPPARAIIATSVRRNAHSPLSRCKSLSYLDNILARQEAADNNADEAVLLNTDGFVAETTIANLFVVGADGILVTPPVADGALPGIRREELLRSMVALERSISADDLRAAREVFLTNALSVRPMVTLDGRSIGDGQPGPLSQRLQKEVMDE
ncbi:aminotransferase class IV [Magnetospirillum gryphiswaldense]|uniref:Probable branched-chain-amino-acid aminotransferase n=1 Tax=Magnetospirillum gryphiswaldense TaxID=55518 RepID=A4TX10_9PROT|nr:aminotransferase class IV [Magnetospirillum gryphiswaldense]AVM74958.1 D-alanine aminotransferase [Magnetospirillum gryphiswaldense MSR-1]AVM78861.1 D-alanine aminotransferase [Magnetospirillum gryphiswaldense]CAM75167.1 Aminotransferase, class IV [Magnetospirillum gryphiswaldense MSR-1]